MLGLIFGAWHDVERGILETLTNGEPDTEMLP